MRLLVAPDFEGRRSDRGRRARSRGVSKTILLLFALAVAIASSPAAGGEPDATTADQAFESLIREWFTLLETAPADPRLLRTIASDPSFELQRAGTIARTPEELEDWIAELRSSHAQVGFAIDSIRIVPEASGLRRAHFEVERKAQGADGAVYVARWHHCWWVRALPGGELQVVRIEQRPALPFPGTGPRIVCD